MPRQHNRRVKATVADEKNKAWEKCCQRIDGPQGYSKVKESWRVLRSLRTPKKGNYVSVIGEKE